MSRDPIVQIAIDSLENAIRCLKRGDRYNNGTVQLQDYFPNGINDHIVKVNEPLLRLHARQQDGETNHQLMEYAQDILGHSALAVGHILSGMPHGEIGKLVVEIGKDCKVGRRCDCEQEKSDSNCGTADKDGGQRP